MCCQGRRGMVLGVTRSSLLTERGAHSKAASKAKGGWQARVAQNSEGRGWQARVARRKFRATRPSATWRAHIGAWHKLELGEGTLSSSRARPPLGSPTSTAGSRSADRRPPHGSTGLCAYTSGRRTGRFGFEGEFACACARARGARTSRRHRLYQTTS